MINEKTMIILLLLIAFVSFTLIIWFTIAANTYVKGKNKKDFDLTKFGRFLCLPYFTLEKLDNFKDRLVSK